MRKLAVIISLAILGIIVALVSVIQPIPIYLSDGDDIHKSKDYQKCDTVKVLADCNFDEGEWMAYIVFVWEDSDNFSTELPKGKILKTTDAELLKKMQLDWNLVYTGGDLATVQSKLLVLKDNKIVFTSNIVLDNGFEALQGGDFGALFSNKGNDLIKYCKQFKRVYSPFVIL